MIDLVAETTKTLRAIPVVLPALVAGLDPEQARARPASEEWSAVEVVAHLRDVEAHALARVRRMLTEDDPHLPGFDQEQLARDSNYRSFDLHQTLGEYLALREEHLRLLDSLTPQDWERTGRHEAHGQVTIASYEVHVAAEEVDHLAQIARLLPHST